MKSLKVFAFASLLLVVTSVFASTSGSTYAVGSCRPNLPSFTTITAAIAGVPAGATILVCPGTYQEYELTITQPLTLQGISSGDSAQVVFALGQPAAFLVLVTGTGPVNISDMEFVGIPRDFGIQYLDASGTLNNLTLCSLPATCPVPSDFGPEVLLTVDDGSSQTVKIENSSFLAASNFGFTAAIQTSVSNGTLGFTIQGNSIVGAPTAITIGQGTGTISGNVIDGLSTGVVGIASAGGVTISGNTIVNNSSAGISSTTGDNVSGNKLVGNGTGISSTGAATFTHNTIMNSNVGIDLGCITSVATSNTISNTQTGFNNAPSSFGTSKNGFFSVPVIKGTICQ